MAFTIAFTRIAKEMDLTETEKGIVFSSIFYGVIGAQVPGGYLAKRFGGKTILVLSFLLAGPASALTSLPSTNPKYIVSGVAVCRLVVGLAQGVFFPAAQSVLAHWIPPGDRGPHFAIAMSGMFAGSAVAMITVPILVSSGRTLSTFYIAALFSLAWAMVWALVGSDVPLTLEEGKAEDFNSPTEKVVAAGDASMQKLLTAPQRIRDTDRWISNRRAGCNGVRAEVDSSSSRSVPTKNHTMSIHSEKLASDIEMVHVVTNENESGRHPRNTARLVPNSFYSPSSDVRRGNVDDVMAMPPSPSTQAGSHETLQYEHERVQTKVESLNNTAGTSSSEMTDVKSFGWHHTRQSDASTQIESVPSPSAWLPQDVAAAETASMLTRPPHPTGHRPSVSISSSAAGGIHESKAFTNMGFFRGKTETGAISCSRNHPGVHRSGASSWECNGSSGKVNNGRYVRIMNLSTSADEGNGANEPSASDKAIPSEQVASSNGEGYSKKGAVKIFVGNESERSSFPWWDMLRSPAAWAIVAGNVGAGTAINVVMSWLPSYLEGLVEVDLAEMGLVWQLLPFLTMMVFSILGGIWYRWLIIGRGLTVEKSSKIVTGVAFSLTLCTLFCMGLARSRFAAVFLSSLALATAAMSRGGWSTNHVEIAPPEHAATLYAVANTFSAAMSLAGLAVTGKLLDEFGGSTIPGAWTAAMGATGSLCGACGTFFVAFARGNEVLFPAAATGGAGGKSSVASPESR